MNYKRLITILSMLFIIFNVFTVNKILMNQKKVIKLQSEIIIAMEEKERLQEEMAESLQSLLKEKQLIIESQQIILDEMERRKANQSKVKEPSRGIEVKTSNIKKMSVTAYCDIPEDQGKWVGKTSSGKKPKIWRTIAAGKNIPFGTKVYIPYFKDKPNKGIFVVEDRGGNIGPNNIDVFFGMNTKEMHNFGRRNLEVHILD